MRADPENVSRLVIAYTDGSAINNPNGPAAWAWYVSDQSWGAGGFSKGSSSMVELFAILAVTRAVPREYDLLVKSDNKNAVETLRPGGWMQDWERRGWRKADGNEPGNLSLIKELHRAMQVRQIQIEHVRGHQGFRGNEIADRICGAATSALMKGQPVAKGPGWTVAPLPGQDLGAGKVQQTASDGRGGRTSLSSPFRSGGGTSVRPMAPRTAPAQRREEPKRALIPTQGFCESCDQKINPFSLECGCSD